MAVEWMKTGAASVQAAVADEAQAKARQEERGQTWRFWLPKGETAKVTFVDGDLFDVEGTLTLAPPRYYEHSVDGPNNRPMFYVCPQETLPKDNHKCPICAAGNFPSLVALFTIIDHRSYTSKGKNGQSDKTFSDQKRLLVVKSKSMEMLTKIAVKRGGLAGCTFDVSRLGENSPSIGDMYDFAEKNEIAALQAAFKHEVVVNNTKSVETYFTPIEYQKEIIFRTGEELAAMGLGKAAFSGAMNPGGASGQLNPGGSILQKTNYASKI